MSAANGATLDRLVRRLRCDRACNAQREGWCQSATDQTACIERRVKGDGKPINLHPADQKRGAFCGSCARWGFDKHCQHLDTHVAADWPSGVCWTANASNQGLPRERQ